MATPSSGIFPSTRQPAYSNSGADRGSNVRRDPLIASDKSGGGDSATGKQPVSRDSLGLVATLYRQGTGQSSKVTLCDDGDLHSVFSIALKTLRASVTHIDLTTPQGNASLVAIESQGAYQFELIDS